jgi:transcriptional regulator with XRE-family HTH domain
MCLAMNVIHQIRLHFNLSQEAFGKVVGCGQSNVGHYENGQTFPIERAQKLQQYAAGEHGVALSLDQIYGVAPLPWAETNQAVVGK